MEVEPPETFPLPVRWMPCGPPLTRFPHMVSTGPASGSVPKVPFGVSLIVILGAPASGLKSLGSPGRWGTALPSSLHLCVKCLNGQWEIGLQAELRGSLCRSTGTSGCKDSVGARSESICPPPSPWLSPHSLCPPFPERGLLCVEPL